jgi:glycosyltransferase involved in cell wall biosynthesis
MRSAVPTVSVIIATYNRSEVLRYAIQSVLAQEFTDFELLVIGDGCTDGSETVVRSFADSRLRWENLPENSGYQSVPNNRGIALARGRYVAYLGHDDLWHPLHLGALVAEIERTGAEFAHSLLMSIGPPPHCHRTLLGLSADGRVARRALVPPSAWLHARSLTNRIGAWRDYRSHVLPPDFELLVRMQQRNTRMVALGRLSVFKFPASVRKNCYVDRPWHEQADWWLRMANEPNFLANELAVALAHLAAAHPAIIAKGDVAGNARPGALTEEMRRDRGLPPAGGPTRAVVPIYADRDLLQFINRDHDVCPRADRERLDAAQQNMPEDGLFVGMNWHGLEREPGGRSWRWIERDAQIVVTRPSGRRTRLAIDLVPGPGLRNGRARLQMRDSDGELIDEQHVHKAGRFEFDLPLRPSPGAVLSFGTNDGGRVVAPDPRVLNFRIFSIAWC